MDLLIWTFFGVINGIILYAFETAKAKRSLSIGSAIMMSVMGAVSGGVLAHLIFGGTHAFNITLLLVLFFEVGLITFFLARDNKAHYRF